MLTCVDAVNSNEKTSPSSRVICAGLASALFVGSMGLISTAQAASKAGAACPKLDARSGGFVCVNEAKKGQRPKLRWVAVSANSGQGTESTGVSSSPSSIAAANAKPQKLVVYSGRTYGTEAVLQRFERETGISLEVVTASDTANRERLRSEGSRSPADVYLTTDVGALTTAAGAGLLAPVQSRVLESAIPVGLRDSGGRWFALSRRARVIYVNTNRVGAAEMPTMYEDLGGENWSGRLCLRPSSHVYTQSLAANLMARKGTGSATQLLRSVAKNAKAENYIDSDTKILETLNAGGCDAAIANTYYYPRLGSSKVPNVRMIFPNQKDGERGAHVNISGAGVVATSSNKAAAQRLIEWLATTGQFDFASGNNEFPANPKVKANEAVSALGEFKADQGAITEYARLQPSAVVLLTDIGWR